MDRSSPGPACAPRHAGRACLEDLSSVRIVRVRVEKLLSVDPVAGDHVLSLRRNQPVDELLAELLLHAWTSRRRHEHDAVLIEETLVAFNEDCKVAAILKREPGAAIGQHISVGC